MADPPPPAWFDELCARGRLAPNPDPMPLPAGNQDRRPEFARPSWRVRLTDGRAAKLTLGTSLSLLAERSAEFASACPDIAAAPLFRETLAHGEALAEAFFDGISIEDAARSGSLPPDTLRRAIARVAAALAATEQPSTDEARAAEWQAWAGGICSLPAWTAAERDLLGRAILPALRKILVARPPVTRWSNGDFLPSNLLVAADGHAGLIDTEFAARTHFFPEDAVRFRVLSEALRRQPALADGVLPEAGLPWHLFFWLRQLALEATQNTAEHLARVLPWRRAVIRRLAGQLFSLPLAGWSVPAAEILHNIEESCWIPAPPHPLRLAGWCHVPAARALRSVVVLAGDRRLAEVAPSPRPDVQAHFHGNERASLTGFAFQLPLAEEDTVLAVVAVTDDGTWLPFAALRAGDLPARGPLILDYPQWAARNDPDDDGPPGSHLDAPAEPAAAGPKFSVLLPVYDTPERLLRECVESVSRQHYAHWELVIVDDASPAPHVRPLLESLAAADPRIHLQFRKGNGGIARATNDALAAARHAFIVLLDHDDRLRPHALTELARRIAADPAVDVLYSDEEKISLEGERVWPAFKPDFSPEFLLGVMYPGHALCVRTEAARGAGGLDPAYDGIQDYEFFLRLTERTRRIAHIPRVLYQWRLAPASSALAGNVKGDMDQRQAEAVRAHLTRVHQPRQVAPQGAHRVRLTADSSAPTQSISIIVAPAANCPAGPGQLRNQLNLGDDRVREILADAGPDSPSDERLQRLAGGAHGDILVLLAFLPPSLPDGWLTELGALASLDDAGAVAPILLSTTGTVFDAGWTIGRGAVVSMMRGFDADGDGYNGSLRCNREVSAVSGLCLAVRRDRYERAGGIQLPLGAPCWALDLSLRLDAAGWRNRVAASIRIPTPFAESFREDLAPGFPAFAVQWKDRLARADPYYNPHFSATAGNYRLGGCRWDVFPAASSAR